MREKRRGIESKKGAEKAVGYEMKNRGGGSVLDYQDVSHLRILRKL